MGKFLKNLFRFKTVAVILTIASTLSLIISYLSPFIAPSKSDIVPLFGLAYSVIITINIILLIGWVIAKSKWSFLIIITILTGFNLHFRVFTLGSNKDSENKNKLSLLSYNVRGFGIYHEESESFSNQYSKIYQYIKSKDVDVICFQEFFEGFPKGFKSTIDGFRNTNVNGKNYYFSNINKKFGVVTLSKYPIIKSGVLVLAGNKSRSIFTDILKENDTLRIINVHLQSIRLDQDDIERIDKEEVDIEKTSLAVYRKLSLAFKLREDQVLDLEKAIKDSPHKTILCGDFNDTPMSFSYNQISKLLTDVYKSTNTGIGSTYAGKLPAGRIDYIFASDEFKPVSFDIQSSTVSDHFAINAIVSY